MRCCHKENTKGSWVVPVAIHEQVPMDQLKGALVLSTPLLQSMFLHEKTPQWRGEKGKRKGVHQYCNITPDVALRHQNQVSSESHRRGSILLRSFFLIALFCSSPILVVYLLGEVDIILISIALISSFILHLLFVSLTFLWAQLTPKPSLSRRLISPVFHKVLYCSLSFLAFALPGPCARLSYLNTRPVNLGQHSRSSQ